MKVWLSFLELVNGKAYFPESEWSDNETVRVQGPWGGGSGFFSKEWVFFQWPQNWVDLGILNDITFLEFVPTVLSMAIWGSPLQNKKFYIDNRTLFDIVNTQTSKSKCVMALMRPFILYTLQNNIIFRARHIDGKNNEIADAISRQQWDRFRRLAPQAQAQANPREIPDHFWTWICNMKLTDF